MVFVDFYHESNLMPFRICSARPADIGGLARMVCPLMTQSGHLMHDHSIGSMAGQVKTSSGELPLIDRLSALTVAIIKDGPDSIYVQRCPLIALRTSS